MTIGPQGPEGSCLADSARIAVLEEARRESIKRQDRIITAVERVDQTLVALVAGNAAVLSQLSAGAERMTKHENTLEDHETRIGELETNKLTRDVEEKTKWRMVFLVGSALGSAGTVAAWFLARAAEIYHAAHTGP